MSDGRQVLSQCWGGASLRKTCAQLMRRFSRYMSAVLSVSRQRRFFATTKCVGLLATIGLVLILPSISCAAITENGGNGVAVADFVTTSRNKPAKLSPGGTQI